MRRNMMLKRIKFVDSSNKSIILSTLSGIILTNDRKTVTNVRFPVTTCFFKIQK